MKFKTWLEEESLPLNQPNLTLGQQFQNPAPAQKTPLQEDEELIRLFNQSKEHLTGGLKSDPTISLNRLEGGPKGAVNALKSTFIRLRELGEPWASQANDTNTWLTQLGADNIKITANATVGQLLAKLFGPKIYEKAMKQPAPITNGEIQSNELQPPNEQQKSFEKSNLPSFNDWKK